MYCPECAKRCSFARLRPLSAIASFQSFSAPARDSFIGTRFQHSARPVAVFAPRGWRGVLCGTFSGVGRNVLVISTVEHADDVLRRHVGDAETVKVVVPVVRQGALDWLANDQKAFGHAERIAERTAEQLSGETVDATAGEADVGLAIRDALATFPADEIVVAVRPHEQEGLVESHATETAPQHRIEGVPVRYVVIGD